MLCHYLEADSLLMFASDPIPVKLEVFTPMPLPINSDGCVTWGDP